MLSERISEIAPALDVNVFAEEDGKRTLSVVANDWLTLKPKSLIDRLYPRATDYHAYPGTVDAAAKFLRPIVDKSGRIYGRACLCPDGNLGAPIVVGGLRPTTAIHSEINFGRFAGVLFGKTDMISRGRVDFVVPAEVIAAWTTEQGELIANSKQGGEFKLACSEIIIVAGGRPGTLPITRTATRFFNQFEFSHELGMLDELKLHLGGYFMDGARETDPPVFLIPSTSSGGRGSGWYGQSLGFMRGLTFSDNRPRSSEEFILSLIKANWPDFDLRPVDLVRKYKPRRRGPRRRHR